jgi:hypothetical protein
MRLIASFLLCSFALTAGAAEIWRWTDANGVVHYSDQPVPGAVRVNTAPAPRPSGSGPLPEPPPEVSVPETQREEARYSSCVVQSPANDDTLHGVQPVTISLSVEPGLQPGHRIQMYVNGAPRTDWPANATTYTLSEVYRGSYTLQARIVDSASRVICTGPTVTFHVQQTGLLSPQSPLRLQPVPRPSTPLPTPRPAPGAPRG